MEHKPTLATGYSLTDISVWIDPFFLEFNKNSIFAEAPQEEIVAPFVSAFPLVDGTRKQLGSKCSILSCRNIHVSGIFWGGTI